MMKPEKNNDPNKRKRGRPFADTEAVNLRMKRDVFAEIDQWRNEQSDKPSRVESVRRLTMLGLQRQSELEKALIETISELATGKFVRETVEQHMKRLRDSLTQPKRD